MAKSECCCKVMVEAPNPHICKVFWHLEMLWMGIWWVHPYADTSEGEWWIFEKYGQWLSLSDVVRSWLRLQLPRDCIP
jgi:hypothetical protein